MDKANRFVILHAGQDVVLAQQHHGGIIVRR
jgi:hypothetical protein